MVSDRDIAADEVEEPDPRKPRPGEPGWSPYEPWEDPAFDWLRELNKEASITTTMRGYLLSTTATEQRFTEAIVDLVAKAMQYQASRLSDPDHRMKRLAMEEAAKQCYTLFQYAERREAID